MVVISLALNIQKNIKAHVENTVAKTCSSKLVVWFYFDRAALTRCYLVKVIRIQHVLVFPQHVAKFQAASRMKASPRLAGSRALPSCFRSSLWSW